MEIVAAVRRTSFASAQLPGVAYERSHLVGGAHGVERQRTSVPEVQPTPALEAQFTSALEGQSTAVLEAQITELAGHLNAANHRLLVLIAEFDRRKGWADSATQSCAHWLSWKSAETGALFVKALNAAVEAMEQEESVSAETSTGEVSAEASAHGVSAETSTGKVSAETSPAAEDPTPGERPAWSVRRADALARIAESFLAHGAEVLPAGDRHQLVVHVDAQTLRDGCAGRCEHEDGPALPVETARRLGCDASVVSIIEDEEGAPLNVGRKTRTIPPALRRALQSRDRGCRFPGCSNKHYVDGHHIRHWADGGETRLSNLALLCRFHHRRVHEGGVTIQVVNERTLRFVMKDGHTLDSPRPARPGAEQGPPAADVLQGDWTHLLATHSAHRIEITPDTAVTRWRGESMDYGTAVDALLHRTRQATSPPSTVVH
jgi:hypothetical protein